MRPASIHAFDKALLAGLAINLVSTVLNWEAVTSVVGDPRLAALGLGQGFVIASVVTSLAIYLLLWFFIARRASKVALWIFVVLTAFSVLNFLGALTTRGFAGNVVQLLAVAVLALQVYAAWLLFRPDAKAWFDAGGDWAGAIRAATARSPEAMTLRLALSGLLAAAALPSSAVGQAFQCSPPAQVAPLSPEAPDGPVRRLPITGHTLALSWSPEFCRTRQADPGHRFQCSGTGGRFGFIVHGLWPESARSWPQWCRKVPPPRPALVRAQLCRTPSARLIGHEWAKHGSCMSRTAEGYFRVSAILANSLRYPAMEQLSGDARLTAGALRQELALANPGRPAASFGVVLNRRGWLSEVRVCHDRRFRPSRCPIRLRGATDAAPVKIWRGLGGPAGRRGR